MSAMLTELYDALRKAGVDEGTARAAAQAVVGRHEDVATKLDIETLQREMAELKADVVKWNVGAMAVLTAIFAAIVRLG
ncbi:MAG: integrase [Acidobacteria bacterium]|nr:integrase [Acidobacteriota bacterium]